MKKVTLGQTGEDLAMKYLREKGYEVLGTNFHKRWGEIDLIAKDLGSGEIVFAEVKARRSQSFGFPEDGITESKWKKLVKTCQSWLMENKQENAAWRIDLVAIEWQKGRPIIEHLSHISL